MFHMKQFHCVIDKFFVRSVKKKNHLFSIMKYSFHYMPTPLPKLKRLFQLEKEGGVNKYGDFLTKEKQREVDFF